MKWTNNTRGKPAKIIFCLFRICATAKAGALHTTCTRIVYIHTTVQYTVVRLNNPFGSYTSHWRVRRGPVQTKKRCWISRRRSSAELSHDRRPTIESDRDDLDQGPPALLSDPDPTSEGDRKTHSSMFATNLDVKNVFLSNEIDFVVRVHSTGVYGKTKIETINVW